MSDRSRAELLRYGYGYRHEIDNTSAGVTQTIRGWIIDNNDNRSLINGGRVERERPLLQARRTRRGSMQAGLWLMHWRLDSLQVLHSRNIFVEQRLERQVRVRVQVGEGSLFSGFLACFLDLQLSGTLALCRRSSRSYCTIDTIS